MYTCTITVPSKKAFLLVKSYLKTLGGTVTEEKVRAKSHLEEALEDVEKGNFAFSGTVEEFFRHIDEISTEKCTQ